MHPALARTVSVRSIASRRPDVKTGDRYKRTLVLGSNGNGRARTRIFRNQCHCERVLDLWIQAVDEQVASQRLRGRVRVQHVLDAGIRGIERDLRVSRKKKICGCQRPEDITPALFIAI